MLELPVLGLKSGVQKIFQFGTISVGEVYAGVAFAYTDSGVLSQLVLSKLPSLSLCITPPKSIAA